MKTALFIITAIGTLVIGLVPADAGNRRPSGPVIIVTDPGTVVSHG